MMDSLDSGVVLVGLTWFAATLLFSLCEGVAWVADAAQKERLEQSWQGARTRLAAVWRGSMTPGRTLGRWAVAPSHLLHAMLHALR